MDASSWLRKQLEEASPDLLRAMVKEMAEALMSADADAACGAGYGERSPECEGHHAAANGSISCPRYSERPADAGFSFA